MSTKHFSDMCTKRISFMRLICRVCRNTDTSNTSGKTRKQRKEPHKTNSIHIATHAYYIITYNGV